MTQSSWFDFSPSFSSPPIDPISSSTIVRNAQIEDVSSISEILTLGFHRFNDFTFWIYPLYRFSLCAELKGKLQDELAKDKNDRESYCLVAVQISNVNKEICQQIVGTVEFSIRRRSSWYNHSKYGYIANLAVNEHYRRQGIASKLLDKCEQIAQEKNLPNISLHVLASNEVGQQLYQKNGYDIKDVETDLYSLFVTSKRRVLMTKNLS